MISPSLYYGIIGSSHLDLSITRFNNLVSLKNESDLGEEEEDTQREG